MHQNQNTYFLPQTMRYRNLKIIEQIRIYGQARDECETKLERADIVEHLQHDRRLGENDYEAASGSLRTKIKANDVLSNKMERKTERKASVQQKELPNLVKNQEKYDVQRALRDVNESIKKEIELRDKLPSFKAQPRSLSTIQPRPTNFVPKTSAFLQRQLSKYHNVENQSQLEFSMDILK